jgi:hypothetical protein
MPVRVFVHLPKLAPGAVCEVNVFRTSAEFAKTESATYSVWAPGVSIEGRTLPGYKAAQEEMRALLAPRKPAAPAPGNGDLFARGSVWRGTSVFSQGRRPAVRRAVVLTITERNGDAFKGKIAYMGARVPSDIVGSAAGGKVKWSLVANGKAGLPHVGVVKGKRLMVTYTGTGSGNEAQKAVVTLDHATVGRR